MKKLSIIVFILIGILEAIGFSLIGLDILGLVDKGSIVYANVNLDQRSTTHAFAAFGLAFVCIIAVSFGIYYLIEISSKEDWDNFQKNRT